LRQNLALEFGDEIGRAENKLNSNIFGLLGFLPLFLNFAGLGNEKRVAKKKNKRKNSKKSNKKDNKKANKKEIYLNEVLAFLFIAFFFVLAFYLGPAITGFTVPSHTSSTDFTGTYNKINKLKYLTRQIKKRGVK